MKAFAKLTTLFTTLLSSLLVFAFSITPVAYAAQQISSNATRYSDVCATWVQYGTQPGFGKYSFNSGGAFMGTNYLYVDKLGDGKWNIWAPPSYTKTQVTNLTITQITDPNQCVIPQ
jgi:hypothetical protein